MTTSKASKPTENMKNGKKSEQLMYVGPSLSKGRLSHATVFLDGFPANVQELLDKHSWLKHLMVPTAEIDKAKESIKQKGSFLNKLAERTKEV